MPKHNFDSLRGRMDAFTIDSARLANVLGDPTARAVQVYLPPGYDDGAADYPLFVCLAGFTGSPPYHLAWKAFGENVPQRLDRLNAEGRMGPVVTVFPDTFTSLGGNQFINSSALGAWADWLLDDVVVQVEERYRVRKGPAHRGVFGKSSGGYGALIHGLRYGDRWGAIASHSGDVGFDVLYRRDLPATLLALEPHDRDIGRFLEHLQSSRKIAGHEMHALMLLAMAATYDPDPAVPYGVRLPVNVETCELDAEAWARWLEHDPLTLIERPDCQERLRGLRGLFIDCGTRDQYFLQYPTRNLIRRFEHFAVPHHYEEFEDNHSSIDYRMDVSLPFLFERLTSSKSAND